ncbi:flagellar protein FlaG [Cellvibrio fibrivorans]|uniref:Flagellar protein FlaG n=1 Tax=Cellvibrio fibrivorans TaxID=126350 RepID=A0ABU1UW44_9GAMM|nr:flagellar protein FlaG [Cellvibrio fibrivorans]MDR7089414.1 flagellar protein FlaG [Cellvibrio fibrivorans]
MNEFTKVAATPVPVMPVPVSPQAGSAKGQKTGNDLPLAADAAMSQPPEAVNSKAIQEKIQAAVAQMNEYIQSTQRDLNFTYDPSSGETVVKVLDRTTQEVIRQIPDETFLRLAQQHSPDEPGQLFSAQA